MTLKSKISSHNRNVRTRINIIDEIVKQTSKIVDFYQTPNRDN